MLRTHIDRYVESHVHNLQRERVRRGQWRSWKAHDQIEEMVMVSVLVGEHVQTMGRQAATVAFAEEHHVLREWSSHQDRHHSSQVSSNRGVLRFRSWRLSK